MEVQVEARWRKSSYSGNGGSDCVEVGGRSGRVLVRDTKDRSGPVLRFSPAVWRRLTEQVKGSLASGPRVGSRLEGTFPRRGVSPPVFRDHARAWADSHTYRAPDQGPPLLAVPLGRLMIGVTAFEIGERAQRGTSDLLRFPRL